jgi:hypothetical protein
MTMGGSADGRQARLTQRFGDGDDRPEAETAGADQPAGPAATSSTSTTSVATDSSGAAGEVQEDTDDQIEDGWEIPTGAGGTGEITDHGADDLESWISQREERGESYGILHIQLRVFSNLSGTNRALQSQKRVDHPSEASGQPPMTFGHGTLKPGTIVEGVRAWKLNLMCQPFYPDLDCDAYPRPARTIPTEHLRVFVADEVFEALRETGHDEIAETLAATVEALNDLDEHHADDEYLETVHEAQSLAAEAGAGAHTGALRRRERRIEKTIRAKLGFTKRHGHEVPDPDEEFAGEDLNTLKELLEETRAERAHAEDQLEELREELAAARKESKQQVRAGLPEL